MISMSLLFIISDFLTNSMSLSKLYDDIVTKANVNHSSREIEDICSAVEEMLERLVSGGIEIYHYEPSFRKVDLQPCGGMAEQTSLWKKTRRQFRQNTFLEFDYLAVLQNEDKVAVLQNEDNVVVLQNEDNVAVLQNEDNVAVLQNEDKVAVLQNEDKVAVLQNEDKVAVLQNEDNVVVLQNEDNVAVLQNEDNVAVLQNEDNVAVLQNEVNVAVLQNEDNWVVLQNEDNVEVLQNEDNVAVLQNEDNVAVLQNEDNVVEIKGGGCQGCRGIYIGDRILSARYFNRVFLEELYSQIHSRCSCCVDPDDTTSEDDRHDSRPCTECTVVKDAGYLQIAKIPDVSQRNVKHSETCSIVFYWTSQTDSLLAPMVETLQPTEKIKRLVIRVDLLPAFEFSSNRDGDQCGIKRFIIAKRCPYCIGLTRNMVSYCMHELNAISHVSDQHRQSYIIIKFLYGQFIYWTGVDWCINNYHAKVAFLTHCQTCTDERKDCTTCITEILQSLVEAYRSKSLRLPEFHPMENLRFDRFGDDDMTSFQIPILSLLHVLSQLKSPNENHQCNSQYRPSHVVGLIKRTNRMLCEQRRPGIVDVDGKFPNCTFSLN